MVEVKIENLTKKFGKVEAENKIKVISTLEIGL